MARPLIAHLPTAFHLHEGQRARLLREQSIGSVIPDLLLGIWSGELPRYGALNMVSRQVLAWLSTQKVANNEEQLRDNLWLSQQAIDSAVSRLTRLGAIAKRDSGEVEIRPAFDVSSSVRLIAIEIKLRRWREALRQAIDYRRFADQAYVVLDSNQVRMKSDISDEFRANGIGLFLQSDGAIQMEIQAATAPPHPSVDRVFALTKLANSGPYCLA